MRQTKFQKAVYWSRKITPILNREVEKNQKNLITAMGFVILNSKQKYTYLYNFLAMLN